MTGLSIIYPSIPRTFCCYWRECVKLRDLRRKGKISLRPASRKGGNTSALSPCPEPSRERPQPALPLRRRADTSQGPRSLHPPCPARVRARPRGPHARARPPCRGCPSPRLGVCRLSCVPS
ncbi:hypothetical protein VULLAG_LOCUS10736 [Vulpes lagopus]